MREFLLGNQWLGEAVERFNDKDWSTEQITDYVLDGLAVWWLTSSI
jgi:hypothetical protein